MRKTKNKNYVSEILDMYIKYTYSIRLQIVIDKNLYNKRLDFNEHTKLFERIEYMDNNTKRLKIQCTLKTFVPSALLLQ